MTRHQFGEGACEKTRRYMDAYLSNELLVETTHDVLRHLESCPACTAELEIRTRLRSRLKAAVQAHTAPPHLPALVRKKLHNNQPARWPFYAVAAAAMVIVTTVWLRPGVTLAPDIADRAGQATYIQKVSAPLAQVFKPGLGDHVHCAFFRRYPPNPPDLHEMETKLGEEYKALLPLMGPAVPEGYRLVMAHQCTYAGRHFIHLTMRKGSDVISLIITRKNPDETFRTLSPAADAAGIPLYQASAANYQVAGFESGNYLIYVVSDLKGAANLEIATALAPAFRQLLS
uniref:Putative transmembrane anti-sigma factor n=1 Tax=Solibacter usitatus (strain Ellin6076) TaxID=234267 RepID=Q022I2_SOLUE